MAGLQHPYAWATSVLTRHPHVYAEFRHLVDDRLRQRPHARLSADMVLHVVRWNTSVGMGVPFKANNNACALYARVYARERGVQPFEMRTSALDDISEDGWAALLELAALAVRE